MPGPFGEDCATCRYKDDTDSDRILCRVNQPESDQFRDPYTTVRTKLVGSYWKVIRPGIDWCGRYGDVSAPTKGTSGVGSIILPTGTVWSPPSDVNFSVFNPPGFSEGNLMHNASFDPVTGALTVEIPGSFGASAVFGAAYSLWGGVILQSQNEWLEITLGDVSGTVYNQNAIYPIGVNKSTDDLPIGFSLGLPAAAAMQKSQVTILVRGVAANAVWISCILGLDVELQ